MNLLFAARPDTDHFARPYINALGCSEIATARSKDVWDAAPGFDWIWLEWGNRFSAECVSQRLPARTMIRIHDYEVRSGIVKDIPHQYVDLFWFINPDVKKAFHEACPGVPEEKCFFLPNALWMDDWPLCAEGEKEIGIITANVQPRKGLDRAVQLMRLLPGYNLTIRTSPAPHFADPQGIRNLAAQVVKHNRSECGSHITLELRHFDPKTIITHRHEVVKFWKTKSHAVSIARHEGFCYGLAEGMACGAAGACLSWDFGSARSFYDCVAGSIEELAEHIQRTGPSVIWRNQVAKYDSRTLARKLTNTIKNHGSQ